MFPGACWPIETHSLEQDVWYMMLTLCQTPCSFQFTDMKQTSSWIEVLITNTHTHTHFMQLLWASNKTWSSPLEWHFWAMLHCHQDPILQFIYKTVRSWKARKFRISSVGYQRQCKIGQKTNTRMVENFELHTLSTYACIYTCTLASKYNQEPRTD